VIAQKAVERFEDRFGKVKLLMNLVSEEMEGMVAVNPVSGALMRLVPIKTLVPGFGSGLHTVTPAHSLTDLRIA
jgi:valyl-tRNA synthetase